MSCTFCGRARAVAYAVTVCNGDPELTESWRRDILPVCPRCHTLLTVGGAGRTVKATGKRWYLGHGIGRFEAVGMMREWDG